MTSCVISWYVKLWAACFWISPRFTVLGCCSFALLSSALAFLQTAVHTPKTQMKRIWGILWARRREEGRNVLLQRRHVACDRAHCQTSTPRPVSAGPPPPSWKSQFTSLNWSKGTIYLKPGCLVEIGNTCGSLSLFHFPLRMLIFVSFLFLPCYQILFGL